METKEISPKTLIRDTSLGKYYKSALDFSTDECYMEDKGKCSINLFSLGQQKTDPARDRNSVFYCRNLYAHLISNNKKQEVLDIDILRCPKCHRVFKIMFMDGRHRFCIAAKTGLNLLANIHNKDRDTPCMKCLGLR
jgi:hypothetical protein